MLHAQPDVDVYFEKIKHHPQALHQFLYEMPKGGELHYHFSGGVYPEVMLSYAQKEPYCLDKTSLALLKMKQPCTGVTSSGIKPKNHWYQRVLHAWSMQGFSSGKESAHDHFFSTFYKFQTVFTDGRSHFLAAIMKRAADQHERYLEVMFLSQNLPSGAVVDAPLSVVGFEKRYERLRHDKQFLAKIELTKKEIKQLFHGTKQDLGCDKRPAQAVCSLVVKFQCYALREQPLQQVFAQALQAFMVANQMDEVVGVNLVQPEDGPISLRDYKKQMAIFGFLHQRFPRVRIALHAGELYKKFGRPQDHQSHIYDAIFVGGASRIGHGVDIELENDHEFLMHYMAKKSLPVEINLTSNAQILHVNGPTHPLKHYLKHHVPVVLSTDDEGILRTSLTREYQIAVQEHGLDYETLKQLSRNVLTYGFLPGRSLWQDAQVGKSVAACTDLYSQACVNYIRHSAKAKLQHALELDFIAFEKRKF